MHRPAVRGVLAPLQATLKHGSRRSSAPRASTRRSSETDLLPARSWNASTRARLPTCGDCCAGGQNVSTRDASTNTRGHTLDVTGGPLVASRSPGPADHICIIAGTVKGRVTVSTRSKSPNRRQDSYKRHPPQSRKSHPTPPSSTLCGMRLCGVRVLGPRLYGG